MTVVRLDVARSGLRDSGGSEALDNELRALAEAQAYGDGGAAIGPRFSRRTVDRFRRMIAARGPDLRDAVFQLTHLSRVAAAVAPSGSALEVLFAVRGRIEPAGLRAALLPRIAGVAGALAHADDDAVTLRYADGGGFAVSYRRLPAVLMLLEFGLGVFADDASRAAWDAAFAATQTCAPTAAGVRAASNGLSRALSARLDQIGRDRTSQQRFAALAAHLDARVETGSGRSYWRLDDAAVLDFWIAARLEDGASFRQFTTVYRWFAALIAEIAAGAARRGLTDAALSVDALPGCEPSDAGVASAPEAASALARLASPPCDRVKLLTKREAGELAIVDAIWRETAPELAVSALRAMGYGADQRDLVAAQQFGGDVRAILARVRAEPDRHGPVVARLRALGALLGRLRLAAAFVLARAHGLELQGEAARQARDAFASFDRRGFGEAERDAQGEAAAAFEEAIEPLANLSALVAALIARLDRHDLVALAARDAVVFADGFAALYDRQEPVHAR